MLGHKSNLRRIIQVHAVNKNIAFKLFNGILNAVIDLLRRTNRTHIAAANN